MSMQVPPAGFPTRSVLESDEFDHNDSDTTRHIVDKGNTSSSSFTIVANANGGGDQVMRATGPVASMASGNGNSSSGVREMSDEALMKAFRELRAKNTYGGPLLGVEVTNRKDRANREGNGLSLSNDPSNYRGLEVSSYLNRKTWAVTGSLFDPQSKKWFCFRYAAMPQKYWQELWIMRSPENLKFYFTTEAQDEFFHATVFPTARTAMQAIAKSEGINPLPEGMREISFHRIDAWKPKRKVYKMITEPGQRVRRTFEMREQKMRMEYYLKTPDDRLVILDWDENTDELSLRVFTQRGELPDPEYSGPIDNKSARGLLPSVRALKGETETDNERLKLLIEKLTAISEFR